MIEIILSPSPWKYAKQGYADTLLPMFFISILKTPVSTFLRDYSVPGPVLNSLHKLTHLILTTTLLCLILKMRQQNYKEVE